MKGINGYLTAKAGLKPGFVLGCVLAVSGYGVARVAVAEAPVLYVAGVNMIDNKSGEAADTKTKDDQPNGTPVQTEPVIPHPKEKKRVNISGYIGGNYVYMMMEVENGRYVMGNILQNGKQTYVSGEIVNGVLYVYDNQGKEYTVKNNDLAAQIK
jgi:hypothetical protein